MATPRELLEYSMMPSGMEDTALKGMVAANQNKDFVQRIVNQNPNVSNSIPLAENGRTYRMTHLMANQDNKVFPTVENKGGVLRQLPRTEQPQESVDLGSGAGAEWFAKNYKRVNPSGFK